MALGDAIELGQMFEATDEDIPASATPVSEAPKKRGRPAGSKNTTTTDRAPRRNTKVWVRQQIASLVGLINIGLVSYPPTKLDALDEREMDLLTDGLTAEAMSSERVLKWLSRASAISPHIVMVQALVAIALPRLQRRGLIPSLQLTPDIDLNDPENVRRMEEFFANGTAGGTNTERGTTVPLETRGAFDNFGGNWFRENDPS